MLAHSLASVTTTTVEAAASTSSSGIVPVVAIIVSALVAIVVPLVTLWLNLRHQRRARQDDRRAQRQREAATALGPTWGVLVDAGPMYLVVHGGRPDSRERMAEIRSRWEAEVRPGLLAIVVGYPEPEARDLADSLANAVTGALALVNMFVLEFERAARSRGEPQVGPGVNQLREQAEHQVEEAKVLWHQLAGVIRDGASSVSAVSTFRSWDQ